MVGKSNWHIKPDRKADAHPLEIYDEKNDRYIYDRNNKLVPVVTIESDIMPETTQEYAEIIKGILKENYPSLEPTKSDVPIAVQLSVYPQKIDAVNPKPYALGYSPIEWEKWLYGALNGLVWCSDRQICATGTEFRQRARCGIRISIYNIREQLRK